MRDGGSGRGRDNGLSEVIGFVLILGVIVVVFSIYLTYGIPAQGRDAEIAHMNEVKDQFIVYKIGLDSLFTNKKIDTTISNSFTLGTGGSSTQGSISIIPLLSPVRSTGTIAINQRTTDPETLTISSLSMIASANAVKVDDLPALVNTSPSHIYINFSKFQSTDLNTSGYMGVQLNGTNWIALVNLTPRTTYFRNFTIASGGVLIPADMYNYNRSDLTLTVIKNNQITIQELILRSNVTTGIPYTVDLLDPAYGLNNFITYPVFLKPSVYNPNSLSPVITGNVTYGFNETSYSYTTPPLGSLEYRGQNNYWISQDYYYQLGGIFLNQVDGNTTYKLPPEITFYPYDPDKHLVTVEINALAFNPTTRGLVGGNSPVQVKTTLDGITALPFVPAAPGYGNTKAIRIGINSTDSKAREMWTSYFNYTAAVAGIPNYQVNPVTVPNESYIVINGYDTTNTTYDIDVIASNATYTTTIHGIGGTYL